MKNKMQKIEYIDSRWCDTINEYYLKNGWNIVTIVPVASHNDIGAYVLLEKEENQIEISENLINTLANIGINLYDNQGDFKSTN